MANGSDDRIPVVFGPGVSGGQAGSDRAEPVGEAVLDEAQLGACGPMGAGLAGHPVGCLCCTPRGGAAAALRALFLARARGEREFARVRVLASPAGEARVRAALAGDVFVAGRFRAG